ncbi:DUF742 domain-containing protein [Streptomyces sp. NPDC051940]|uniref:DUF742 domain-containing protein n=1 Tax=Streptomyces sp. NPDC051940 TaxID=3155675 RepID=UPI003445E4C1
MSGERGTRRTRTFALTAAMADGQRPEGITMHSTVRTVADPKSARHIPEEWQRILALCTGSGLAVAEVSARIGMRLTPTVDLLRELVAHGLVEHSAPLTEADASNIEFLRRLRRGLERG